MSFRNALQAYIDDPDRFKDVILYSDENALIIKDMYPKSIRHYLVIPKDKKVTHLHPLGAFKSDVSLFIKFDTYIEIAKRLIVDDLLESGLLSRNDSDKPYLSEFSSQFIKAGVHAVPSLNNLHIHVITNDFFSSRLKNKKHYNSFTTAFFVDYSALEPKEESDEEDPESSDSSCNTHSISKIGDSFYLQLLKSTPMRCSYCGVLFGNKFLKLKDHLEIEFCQKFKVSKTEASRIDPNESTRVLLTPKLN
ncbi:uncharacterized protein PRCAT00001674001 [Priceomyces carsonii]|uniref:uncharacterized protein n=1 Tax=Priceomyces carsonii TaxID=28549 RepID=UPI002ED87803|nr:unnamed protein product [Priceomyces carsonii]